MSMDAGGLAQMTYNNFQPNGGLGLPGAGFASRGKGNQLKRLSLASPPKVAPINENQAEVSTPRTSRSHLLAGLRTAPKTPGSQVPASAPYSQAQHRGGGLDSSRYAQQNYNGMNQGVPQTAIGAGFGTNNQYSQQQYYDGAQQVLAPPPVQFDDPEVDPGLAAQLLATELYLAQRQQQLQQQLLQLTAQQFTGMSLGNTGVHQQQQYPNTPFTPNMNLYNQQLNGVSVQQETGQPGVYLTYNHLTGQYSYVVDQNQQGQQQNQTGLNLASSPPPPTPSFTSSPPKTNTPTFRAEVSPPNESNPSPWGSRSTSPPKKSSSPPQEVVPLPPPSANAFRRGHKKTVSSLALSAEERNALNGPKSAITRPVGFPQTPMTGTFGPGQSRAGEHPVRQPRGPPPFEELKVSPTTKHEGSKNFATRQRRRAVHSLVRAGIERRGVRTGSNGSMSPVSETEMGFPLSSDNDSDSVHSSGSGSLSGKPSIGSLRAAANGAIGSERKELKERSYTANSVSSDEGASIGGGIVEIIEEPKQASGGRRKTPMLVLTSAEKRKSTVF